MIHQAREDAIGHGADAELEDGVVRDEGGDVFADLDLGGAGGLDVEFGERMGRVRDCDEPVDFGDVEEGAAEGARHVGVDLGDDAPGVAEGGEGAIDTDAHGHIAELVGGRDLDEGVVERDAAGVEKSFNFMEEDGHVVGAAVADGVADVVADEEGGGAEGALVLGEGVVGVAQGFHVDDVDVLELGGAGGEGAEEVLGGGGGGLDPEGLMGADAGDGFSGGMEFGGVFGAPIGGEAGATPAACCDLRC